MSCRETREKLEDYLRRTLVGEARREVEDHLAVCAACREECGLLEAYLQGAEALPRMRAPEGFLAAVRGRLEGRRPPRWRLFSFSLKLVTTAALLFVTVTVLRDYPPREMGKGVAVPVAETSMAGQAPADKETGATYGLLPYGTDVEVAAGKRGRDSRGVFAKAKKASPEVAVVEQDYVAEAEKPQEQEEAKSVALSYLSKGVAVEVVQEEPAAAAPLRDAVIKRREKAEEEAALSSLPLDGATAGEAALVSAVEETPSLLAVAEAEGESPEDGLDLLFVPPSDYAEEQLKGDGKSLAANVVTARETAPQLERAVAELAQSLGGRMLPPPEKKAGELTRYLSLEVPGDKYDDLLAGLKELGVLRRPLPVLKEQQEGTLHLRLYLLYEGE